MKNIKEKWSQFSLWLESRDKRGVPAFVYAIGIEIVIIIALLRLLTVL